MTVGIREVVKGLYAVDEIFRDEDEADYFKPSPLYQKQSQNKHKPQSEAEQSPPSATSNG